MRKRPLENISLPSEKTLVLDLDETLVHSSLTPTSRGFDFSVEVKVPGASKVNVYIKVINDPPIYTVILCSDSFQTRPFLREFLEKAYSLFEVVVFSASPASYANKVLDVAVDPERLV